MALSWSEVFARVPLDSSTDVDCMALAGKLELQDPAVFVAEFQTLSPTNQLGYITSMVTASKTVFGNQFTPAEFKFIRLAVDCFDAPKKKAVLPEVPLNKAESAVVDMVLATPMFREKQCKGCAKQLAPFRTPVAGYSCNGCAKVFDIGTWVNACNDHEDPQQQVHLCTACNNGAVLRLGGPEIKKVRAAAPIAAPIAAPMAAPIAAPVAAPIAVPVVLATPVVGRAAPRAKMSRSLKCLASTNRAPNTDINLTYVGRSGAMVDADRNIVAYGTLRRKSTGAFFLDYGDAKDWYQLREGYDFILGVERPEVSSDVTSAITALADPVSSFPTGTFSLFHKRNTEADAEVPDIKRARSEEDDGNIKLEEYF